jgi:hypothetical protein
MIARRESVKGVTVKVVRVRRREPEIGSRASNRPRVCTVSRIFPCRFHDPHLWPGQKTDRVGRSRLTDREFPRGRLPSETAFWKLRSNFLAAARSAMAGLEAYPPDGSAPLFSAVLIPESPTLLNPLRIDVAHPALACNSRLHRVPASGRRTRSILELVP